MSEKWQIFRKLYEGIMLPKIKYWGDERMSILTRFKDIMASNINALLDKAEDPEKMIDQYLRNLKSDLGKVKSETATIMAQENRARRERDENNEQIEKMHNYAIKALEAENENDARKFLEKKSHYQNNEEELENALELAKANTVQMRQMHDKLVSDIDELEAKRSMLKGKAAVAKTQQRMNDLGSSLSGANSTKSAFDRMEDKINQSLDEANAMAELNKESEDDIEKLASKYQENTDVDSELAALKLQVQEKTDKEEK